MLLPKPIHMFCGDDLKRIISFLSASVLGIAASPAVAGIIQISQSAFVAGSGEITFSEYPDGTVNPVYTPAMYGGGAGSPTVTFGGYFVGQSAGSTNPGACPAGAIVSGCVLGNPTGPLTISPASPPAFITDDGAMPTTPVLSGSPQFNGPIAIEFSTPQAGVGLIGGYFNSVDSTGITAFAADGTVLGTVSNSQIGNQFLGLVTSDGSAQIAGIEFALVGNEPFGFDIDNLQFGTEGQVTVPGAPVSATPEPSSLMMLGSGLLSIPAIVRRRLRA